MGSNAGQVILKTLKWYLLPSCLALDIKRKEGGVNMGSYHCQLIIPHTVALTDFEADLWPRVMETDVGAALCAIQS